MCCLEGRHFFRAQDYSLISLMVNPALIVPLTKMAHANVKWSILVHKFDHRIVLNRYHQFDLIAQLHNYTKFWLFPPVILVVQNSGDN